MLKAWGDSEIRGLGDYDLPNSRMLRVGRPNALLEKGGPREAK